MQVSCQATSAASSHCTPKHPLPGDGAAPDHMMLIALSMCRTMCVLDALQEARLGPHAHAAT